MVVFTVSRAKWQAHEDKLRQDKHETALEINRLNKFYEPTCHKATPKVKCCAENRVYVNMGGEIATATPTGIVNTDVQRLQPLREPVVELKSSKFEKKTEKLLWCDDIPEEVNCRCGE